MKPKQLVLNRETLRRLDPKEVQGAQGGVAEPTQVSKCLRCRTQECR